MHNKAWWFLRLQLSRRPDAMKTDRKKTPNDAKTRRKELFDLLHREVEIAEFATGETGQRRRKTPRAASAARTKKRKVLEKSDAKERDMHGDDDGGRRLRGSRRALDAEVIHGSRVFRGQEECDAEESEDIDDEEIIEEGDRCEQLEESGVEIDGDLDDDEGDDEEEEDAELDDDEAENQEQPSKKAAGRQKRPGISKRRKRIMYRMRNFKSARMAERHGDALGAHARGQSLAAVKKLEQVAADAPTAPQVYSSLGMVYESLLSDSRKKWMLTSRQKTGEDVEQDSNDKQLELAKKAYGSYHVAAVLCKKDFTLWVRAGDTAKEIADLYTEKMASADLQNDAREELREEKKRWLEEAKKDYNTADNLKPPGIDVPAKLASAHMELGNLLEALTILTDLKNRGTSFDAASEEATVLRRRSEFEKSYKVWLLYGDLMLRIGHECTQWNKDNQQNPNYMFRRWLRKWSHSFDWQERRLQALARALEAAAGSASCDHLIQWTQNRASKVVRSEEEESNDERRWHLDEMGEATVDPKGAAKDSEPQVLDNGETAGEQDSMGYSDLRSISVSKSANPPEFSLDTAREALLEKNRLELEVFDEETEELGILPDSDELLQRGLFRSALVDSHRKAVVDLIGNFHQHQAAQRSISGDKEVSSRVVEPLPIAASCATVCSIASQLMMHCLRFELFQGARLVGEAVSAYLKERAGLLESRIEKNRSFARTQQSTDESVLLHFESYDEVGAEDSEDDADMSDLSDDEIFMQSLDESLVTMLKNGILPPELRFLFALSLFCEGGRAFLARKYIVAVEAIQDEDEEAHTGDPIDTDIVKDPLWHAFRHEMSGPLRKTAAFAFALDVLQKVKKETECADVMVPLLQRYLDNLRTSGLTIDAILNETELSRQATVTRNQIVKLMLASARMEIENAKSIISTQEPVAFETALSVLEQIVPLFQKSWNVEENGSVPSLCVEGLRILAKTFEVLGTVRQHNGGHATQCILAKLLGVLSVLCGAAILDPFQSESSAAETHSKQWTDFPIQSDWQNEAQQNVSKRVFNLAIGCCVSNFSGWENDEFNLDLIKRGSSNRHFCVDIHGERVTGYLPPTVEAELADQWKKLGILLPELPNFDFDANLVTVKSSSWYTQVMKNIDESSYPVSMYGDEDGLSLFLSLSRLCLDAASSAASDTVKDTLIHLAVSVIIPLSEFGLDQQLWDSSLGKSAISTTSAMYEWSNLARSVGELRAPRGRRPRPPIKQPGPVKKQRLLPTLVKIPVLALMAQWNDGTTPAISEEAIKAMRQVDVTVKQLRACYTEAAIQKGCLQVALALMELVKKDYTSNPFLCLHQAAIFASNGSKGGNSDEAFKQGLPKERECTPLEALVIIGNADCLQSLYFPDEAIYLCSYVARVSRLHRDKQETDMEWNAQWRVIGICVYNLSVSIRTTLSYQEDRPEYWEQSVVEELKRGRADAIALRRTLSEEDTLVDEGEPESNDEDNFDQGQESGDDFVAEDVSVLAAESQAFDMFRPSSVNVLFTDNSPDWSSDDEGEIIAV